MQRFKELSRQHSVCKPLKEKRRGCGQGQNRTADTRIFSPHTVPRLYVTIGRCLNLFERLTAAQAGRFYRFEHIVAYSFFKVVAK